MSWSRNCWVVLASIGACAPGLLSAEESAVGKDLAATIALQGMPCDKVVNTTRKADSDYDVACKDGNRYHVYVDANGRVVVKKL